MKVNLLCHTPNPEKTIAAAARLCYSNSGADELFEGMTDEKASDYVAMLERLGHESPLEHVTFTFTIEGVSRAFLAQITRHRIASFSVQSQRYVAYNDGFGYVTPPSIEALGAEAEKRFSNQTERIARWYTDWLAQIDAEDARFVLPNACETHLIVTMNARQLKTFLGLRLCNRAQWEIRELAWEMLAAVKKEAPMIFKDAGPGCVRGRCPEGKRSCGEPYKKEDANEAGQSV